MFFWGKGGNCVLKKIIFVSSRLILIFWEKSSYYARLLICVVYWVDLKFLYQAYWDDIDKLWFQWWIYIIIWLYIPYYTLHLGLLKILAGLMGKPQKKFRRTDFLLISPQFAASIYLSYLFILEDFILNSMTVKRNLKYIFGYCTPQIDIGEYFGLFFFQKQVSIMCFI